MGEHDEQLARYLKEVAEALRETTRLQAEWRRSEATPPLPSPRQRGPTNNPQHRTWRGFVEDLQALERLVRVRGRGLTKTNFCTLSGTLTVRTLTRTMEWYGLAADDWPPSTWNAAEVREGGKTGA